MLRSHHFIATCFAIIALGTSAVGASAGMRSATGNGSVVEITDPQPFTHVAYIPTGSGLSSIRIEGVKLVKVATKRPHSNERALLQSALGGARWLDGLPAHNGGIARAGLSSHVFVLGPAHGV